MMNMFTSSVYFMLLFTILSESRVFAPCATSKADVSVGVGDHVETSNGV